MGKPITKISNFGQNQGIAWSSDSNLWENQLLKYQVLDRTKILHGPRTQTYGETNYLKIKFWTELRYCMVLGLKPIGKPITKISSFGQNQGIAWSSDSNLWGNQLLKNQVFDRTKVLHGPRTQTYGETNYL